MLELPYTPTNSVNALLCNRYRQYVHIECAVYAEQITDCCSWQEPNTLEMCSLCALWGLEGMVLSCWNIATH